MEQVENPFSSLLNRANYDFEAFLFVISKQEADSLQLISKGN